MAPILHPISPFPHNARTAAAIPMMGAMYTWPVGAATALEDVAAAEPAAVPEPEPEAATEPDPDAIVFVAMDPDAAVPDIIEPVDMVPFDEAVLVAPRVAPDGICTDGTCALFKIGCVLICATAPTARARMANFIMEYNTAVWQ